MRCPSAVVNHFGNPALIIDSRGCSGRRGWEFSTDTSRVTMLCASRRSPASGKGDQSRARKHDENRLNNKLHKELELTKIDQSDQTFCFN